MTSALRRSSSVLERLIAGRVKMSNRLFLKAIVWRIRKTISQRPLVGWVRFGSLRRLKPISRCFGYDRGETPIDRYYIEEFLRANIDVIRGTVLEVGDNNYTVALGGRQVKHSDVLHAVGGNPRATVVADLSRADAIASSRYDCIILTQVLQCVYDIRNAISHVERILKPGGVLLATFTCISQLSRYDVERWGEYWRLTPQSAQRLFEEVFPKANISLEVHGNVLAATALLYGLTSQELHAKELDHTDPDYPVVITMRAVKSRKLG